MILRLFTVENLAFWRRVFRGTPAPFSFSSVLDSVFRFAIGQGLVLHIYHVVYPTLGQRANVVNDVTRAPVRVAVQPIKFVFYCRITANG